MTVFARSDVSAVAISPDHGGCGTVHSRPAPGGVPVKVWALNCPDGCENFLRKDSLWGGQPHEIPETHDEKLIREDVEKRGQLEQQTAMATALHDLAKLGDLPNAIAQLALYMAGDKQKQLDETPVHLCRNGHPNTSTAKFCGECGADMIDAANKKANIELPPVDMEKEKTDIPVLLDALSLNDLKDIAAEFDIPVNQRKADLVRAIKEARGE